MVEEIMKFTEELVAIIIVATQNLHETRGLRVFVFVNSEVCCFGHLFLYL